ncbi:hypothetical protein [Serratia sp. 1D1416]|uniref:hypothetical protein n=1 Tax=Serratia sp. 1D1416 TaxID=2447890 RepID=UPI001013CA9D|nr:hypothetical protein [Serratia sp. 1D1416]
MMKMMSKLSLVALALCAASTAVHAEDKSYGTATAKMTVNAMQEWKIEKVQDGNFFVDSGNALVANSISGGKFAQFKVSNLTNTAAKYSITGVGTSVSDDGDMYMVNDADNSKIKIKPAKVVGKSTQNFSWNSDSNKYVSVNDVAANSSDEFYIYPVPNVIPVGSYTTTVELFAPSV